MLDFLELPVSATDSSSRSMVEIENPGMRGCFQVHSRRPVSLQPTGWRRPI